MANDGTPDVRVLKSQRRIDINYVDELVVNEFFEPGPGPSKSGVFLISCLADQPRCHKSGNQDGQRTEHDEPER